MASPSARTPVSLSLAMSHSTADLPSLRSAPSSSASALAIPTASPSPFLLTLQIVRLVNTFRKRAKTRVQARRPKKASSAKVRRDFCQEVEREAFEEIDRYLGRRSHHRSLRKGQNVVKHTPSPRPTVEATSNRKNGIDWYVNPIMQLHTLTCMLELYITPLPNGERTLAIARANRHQALTRA